MQTSNLLALLLVVALIVGVIIYLESGKVPRAPTGATAVIPVLPILATATSSTPQSDAALQIVAEKAKKFPRAKEITTPDGFINTSTGSVQAPLTSAQAPVTIGEFVGKKVILLDIWTYSCINCQRTLPYLTAWWDKYKDKGLVIIGLHTPEFEFEKNYDNVLAAVKKFGIGYPVVLDNDFSTWNAYGNRYWPRHYLIDIDGFIVADHTGEGGYEETERQIQAALVERLARLGETGEVTMPVTKEEPVPRAGNPETYFGSARNEYLGNGTRGVSGVQNFVVPSTLGSNTLYLGGEWKISGEYAETASAEAEIVFKYRSGNVYFVANANSPTSVTVLRDGKPLGAEKGADVSVVKGESQVTISESRLYKLIENDDGGEHTLRLIIHGSGIQAYTFTFG